VPVAHACNPSYSGCRENPGLKPARANIFARPYLKKTLLKKRVGRMAQGIGLKFKSQDHKKRKIKKVGYGGTHLAIWEAKTGNSLVPMNWRPAWSHRPHLNNKKT
jgi:hypothetical protein